MTVDWSCRVEPPPSTNALYSGRRFKTEIYKSWITVAGARINLARGNLRKPIGRCEIIIRTPLINRRDLDNFLKPLLDALVHMRIVERDNMTCVRKITIECDETLTACEISVHQR